MTHEYCFHVECDVRPYVIQPSCDVKQRSRPQNSNHLYHLHRYRRFDLGIVTSCANVKQNLLHPGSTFIYDVVATQTTQFYLDPAAERMRIFHIVIFATSLLLLRIQSTTAEFGIPKATTTEAAVDAEGNVLMEEEENNPYIEIATHLQSIAPINIQDAIDIAAFLHAAKSDEDTKLMVFKLKNEQGEALAALSKEVTPMEIVQEMKKTVDEMKAMEFLFQDPVKTFTEMEREGMIEKSRLDFYKKNPEALVDDTRKGIYFGFVSMAVAGGFLE